MDRFFFVFFGSRGPEVPFCFTLSELVSVFEVFLLGCGRRSFFACVSVSPTKDTGEVKGPAKRGLVEKTLAIGWCFHLLLTNSHPSWQRELPS